MFPQLAGRPIRVEVRGSLGSHLAAASLRRRLILLDTQVFARRGDFERILIHELFHFAWVRLSNQQRRAWEDVLLHEWATEVAGELGWSAEWRKDTLRPKDIRGRTPRWRRYACESFCDTAAWLFAGLPRHEEYTLASPLRRLRRRWFMDALRSGRDTLKV